MARSAPKTGRSRPGIFCTASNYLVLLVLGVAPLPASAQDTVTPEATPAVREYVYKKTPQGELKMFVHLPPGWKKEDRRPAIVFFFGGGWRQGSPEQFRRQAEYLAGRGMVAARADYRVRSRHQTTPDKCVEDAKSAVRYLRKNAADLGIDSARLVGAGGSAGGHIAACAALTDTPTAKDDDLSISCKPNALVLFNPVVDLSGMGFTDADGKDLAESISPIRFVRKDMPPAILFFGTEDRFFVQGKDFLGRARAAGVRVELYSAAGMPHGFFNRPPYQEITLRQADAFLVSLGYLKGAPTIQAPEGAKETLKREEAAEKSAAATR